MSMQLTNHQGDLDAIKALLKKRFLPEKRELKAFSIQLEKIDRSINKALTTSDVICKKFLEKQRELVHNLTGRCHQLEVRRDVINLAEDAEALANSSPDRPQEELAIEANNLRDRMESFLMVHRPSKNNSKFIRFANACIAKAERREPVMIRGKDGRLKKVISIDTFKSKEVTLDMFDLAESLYGLASLAYHNKIKEFKTTLTNSFSEETRKEIIYHVSMVEGSLEKMESKHDRIRVVQGILGYSHDLTDYYMDESPYPSIVEIHQVFKDLEFLSHTEEEDPSLS